MELFESFDEIVTPGFINDFKTYLNDNQGDLTSGSKGIFYIFLAGLIKRSYSEMSSSMLFDQMERYISKTQLPEKLSDIFKEEGGFKKILNNGSEIISQIFPAYKSPLISTITTYSGLSKATATTASQVIANVVIVIFQKYRNNGNWDADEMVSILRQHHEPLLEAIPEDFKEKMIPSLGLQDLLKVKAYVPKKEKARDTSRNSNISETPKPKKEEIDFSADNNSESGSMAWIIGGAILLLAILGGVYYYYQQNGGFDFFSQKEVPVESNEVEKFEEVEQDTLANPGLEVYGQLKEYVANKSEAAGKEFEFKTLTFDSLNVAANSTVLVDSIASLLTVNPDLQLKITTFSNVPDKTTNNKRAFAVKKMLVDKGVSDIRLDPTSGGLGDEKVVIKVVKK